MATSASRTAGWRWSASNESGRRAGSEGSAGGCKNCSAEAVAWRAWIREDGGGRTDCGKRRSERRIIGLPRSCSGRESANGDFGLPVSATKRFAASSPFSLFHF